MTNIPEQGAANPLEVRWFYAAADPTGYTVRVYLERGGDDLAPTTASEYLVALAILADPRSKFLIPLPGPRRLSTGVVSTTAAVPVVSADRKEITSYVLQWAFRTASGVIQITFGNGTAYSLPFADAAAFAASCLTLQTRRTAYYQNGMITTKKSDTE